MNQPQSPLVIIGAGPTGLGAAHRLAELGYDNFAIYERSKDIAGLAGSVTDAAGFTWDIGVHVSFSHYKYFAQCFDRVMGTDFQLNTRQSWVRLFDRWIPYPFQNNIRHLPAEIACECLIGLIEAQTRRDRKTADNFKEFADAVFGDGIVKHFMQPYVSKAWSYPPELMNTDWVGERVAVIDIRRAVRNVVLGEDDLGWGPNSQFKYPLCGGTGEFYRRLAKPLSDKIHLERKIDRINLHTKEIRFEDGAVIKYHKLLSAMPLDLLFSHVLDGDVPAEIRKAAAALKHSGGYMVGIGIKGICPSSRSWTYFPEDNCPFHRASCMSNFSPYMTPDNSTYYSLLCETSYSDFKPIDGSGIVDQTVQGLVNTGIIGESDRSRIVDTWLYKASHAYPTPTIDRDRILNKIIPFLERHGIFSRGRFGFWKYEISNADHSFMQGVELVNRWLFNEPETTIRIEYESTEDGRSSVHHD